ncbi:hypothetical protein [Roseimaritima sediminicola]|nr:hypothetical protein [Roseimaritima sediminicola]
MRPRQNVRFQFRPILLDDSSADLQGEVIVLPLEPPRGFVA